jgi:hypothetical protein
MKPAPGEEGYSAFADVAQDLDELLDVVWVSGSRKLVVKRLEASRC